MIREALIILTLVAGIATSSAAIAFEGVAINDTHAGLKERLQSENVDKKALKDIRSSLRKLVSATERQSGKYGPDVAILLIDMGEAAVREATFPEAEQQRDLIVQGISSLRTGLPQLMNWTTGKAKMIAQIGRGYRILGQAHLSRRDKPRAAKDLEEGLRFLEEVDAPVRLQLAFYPLLRTAAANPAGRKSIVEREIALAETLSGPDAEQRLAEARSHLTERDDGVQPLTIRQLEEIRKVVETRAAEDQMDLAYGELQQLYARVKTSADKTLFIARMKPAMFWMFPDPNAAPMIHWNDYQHQPLTPYDRIAARFFVERDLRPYLTGFNDVSLLDYQDQLNIQLIFGGIITENYGKIADRELRDLCRLLPSGPASYDIDLEGAGEGIPAACIGPVRWGGQLSSMKLVGKAIKILEIGMKLLPQDRPLTPLELSLLTELSQERLQLESNFGSPDTFLTLYEQFSESGTELPFDLELYRAIIQDDSKTFTRIVSALPGLKQDAKLHSLEEKLRQKLPAAGVNVASEVCNASLPAINIIDKAAFCLSTGKAEDIDRDPVRLELASLPIDGSPIMIGGLLSPDWRLWELLRRADFNPVRKHFERAFAPRGFTARPLSGREQAFLRNPITVEEYEKKVDRFDYLFSEDFNAVLIADELARRGDYELAIGWANIGEIRYRSADSPGTLLLSHLATNFHEESYRDGWRWLITGHPVQALAGLQSMIPQYRVDGAVEAILQQTDDQPSEIDWERVIGAGHGAMIASLQLGDTDRARNLAVRLTHYLRSVLAMQSFSRNETQEVILRVARPALEYAADILAGSASKTSDETDAVFQIGQLLSAGGTGGTVTRLGARLGAVSTELADLARRREEMRRQWAQLDPSRVEERKDSAAKVDELDGQLKSQFPKYVELAGVSALSIEAIKPSLASDEAMLSYLRTGDSYIVTAITTSLSVSFKLEASAEEIDNLVRSTRRGVQIRGGRLPNFRFDDAHALYKAVLEPVERVIEGQRPRKLLVVPDGALETIPFSVLVASPDDRPGGRVEWIADRYTVTRLPSATSMPLLRGTVSKRMDMKPFMGIGDPALDGAPDDLRGYSPGEVLALRGGAEAERLRALPRLPDTADELRQLSLMLDAPVEQLLLGDQATESIVRSIPLDSYEILAFATHGLVAGEISSLREPGLVLTPSKADEQAGYDGYLSASEIAEMRLNADLVLLSACNTAAPGAQGADGLSGLARSFFFAGTKSLLVSHWAVDSLAATRLTTTMLRQYRQHSGLSYAEALGLAMKEMRHTGSEELSHPALWAPFEIVGAD